MYNKSISCISMIKNLPGYLKICSFDFSKQFMWDTVIKWELSIQHSEQHHSKSPHVTCLARIWSTYNEIVEVLRKRSLTERISSPDTGHIKSKIEFSLASLVFCASQNL